MDVQMATEEKSAPNNPPGRHGLFALSSLNFFMADILGSLKSDAQRKYPEVDVSSVVITVPAHFSTVQSEATKRAGQLAGFSNVVLLQEPIAAAIAYGLEGTSNQNWLVFDFGGGTFDVALIAARDGHLTILDHGGDNYLGGKDIDFAIVNHFLLPKLGDKPP
jgi:molecular chaperone DnaK